MQLLPSFKLVEMTDPVFEALSNVPNHLSSFSASLKDGNVIQVTITFFLSFFIFKLRNKNNNDYSQQWLQD